RFRKQRLGDIDGRQAWKRPRQRASEGAGPAADFEHASVPAGLEGGREETGAALLADRAGRAAPAPIGLARGEDDFAVCAFARHSLWPCDLPRYAVTAEAISTISS